MTNMKYVAACLLVFSASVIAQEQSAKTPASHTQVVLLGTGNPPADPDRSGPATAIVVNGAAYLVDFGAGVVRRAKAAVAGWGENFRWRSTGRLASRI